MGQLNLVHSVDQIRFDLRCRPNLRSVSLIQDTAFLKRLHTPALAKLSSQAFCVPTEPWPILMLPKIYCSHIAIYIIRLLCHAVKNWPIHRIFAEIALFFSPHHYAHLCYFCGFSIIINLPPDFARILQLYSLAPITPSRPHVRLHNSRKWAAKLRKITKKNKFSYQNSAIFLIFAVFLLFISQC